MAGIGEVFDFSFLLRKARLNASIEKSILGLQMLIRTITKSLWCVLEITAAKMAN